MSTEDNQKEANKVGLDSATLSWGDGSSSAGSVSLNPDGSYSVTGSHTYAEEGPPLP